jgi:Asp-tRNA(Asn)/Glu-tRNA(Gln) amidotransferase A subunit family amidase
MAELHDLTALEQGAAVAAREVSPVELVDHYLARVERLSDEVGAFVTVTADLARRQARLAEAGVGDRRSALYGVPTAVKDLNTTAGVVTEFGSATMAGHVPEVSDEVVLRLEAAGTISLGKTSTPEFGSPCYTEPDNAPPARTPWDLTRMAGGSSGGAAAAVAAGLVPLAQGSDGGGSIRIPASCCGLVGLKPSRGRISAGPVYGDPVGLGTAGSLARTVRDAAALLDVLAGPAVGDPSWAPPPASSFLAACDTPPGRLRVARFVEPVIAEAPVHPEVVAAYEAASDLLVSLGHDRAVGGPARHRAPAAAADPLAGGPRPGGVGSRVRAGDRRAQAPRGHGAARAGALRRRADPDRGPAAAADRGDPRRCRPGAGLRGPEGLHPVDLGVERHRDAGGVPAAARHRRRPAGRGDAGGPARGGDPAALTGGPGRGGGAVGRAHAAVLVTAC